MPLPMPAKKEFEKTPEGTHYGICTRVIDLGTQETNFNGEIKKKHQITLGWETPDEITEGSGKPFFVSKRYTYSSDKKSALRRDLESWRGVPFQDAELGSFDIMKLLGACCFLGVVHNGEYANVSSVMRLPKGTEKRTASNELIGFSLSAFDKDVFDKLPDSLKAVIQKSPEYQELMGAGKHDGEPVAGNMPDDDGSIPF